MQILKEKIVCYKTDGTIVKGYDAGELIRCKDCMYYSQDPWGYGLCECRDYRRVNEKDFCSWAERKEE